MKSDRQLGEEARAILNDPDHVLWAAIARHEADIKADAFNEPSPAALPGYYYRARGLKEVKEALRVLANAVPSERTRLEAVSG